MTERQPTLLDDLDNTPVGHAPVGDLLVGGKAAKRRQRRSLFVGAAAATLLVAAGGTIVTQALAGSDGQPDRDSLIADGTNNSDRLSLPCDVSEQTMVMFDLAGPGQPTPRQAVAPHAGALTLVVQESAGDTTVFGLRDDGSVFRAFQVTKRDDGWWPDGYRECSG